MANRAKGGQLRRLVAVFAIAVSGGWVASPSTFASTLENLRDDLTVPEHCRTTELRDFDQDTIHVFTVGPTGARDRGFDYEFPLLRHHATLLYRAMRSHGEDRAQYEAQIRRQQDNLWATYQMLRQNHEDRDFHFEVEGEILELLSIVRMQARLDRQGTGLFVSGSVEYHPRNGGNTLGELDMIVGDKMTCEILGYGEVKLGVGSLSKARQQVHRFFNFMHSMGLSPRWLDPELGWFNDYNSQRDFKF